MIRLFGWRNAGVFHRRFWSGSSSQSNWFGSRVELLEKEANKPENALNVVKQGKYLQDLLRFGYYNAVIQRFESQPQLNKLISSEAREKVKAQLQSDRTALDAFVQALVKQNRSGEIAAKLQQLQAPSKSTLDVFVPALEEKVSAVDSKGFAAGATSPGQFSGTPAERETVFRLNGDQPLPVVVTESTSWSQFSKQLITKISLLVVGITGVSALLDQQGILKSSLTSVEVGPLSGDKLVKFSDVQGIDEAKQELEDVVQFLKNPERFMSVGGKLPKGVLLYGPPGTGKTYLARAVAGEAGVPFFQMSGSEFDELYVGVGARRIRELFASAKKKAPCIVFIDEIDAVGSKRNARDQSYMRQTLNQLLVELDGFSSSQGVIFIAATNTPEALDKALVRPGRLDRLVAVPLPDVSGREKILEIYAKKTRLYPDIELSTIARGTPGFSGADLANLVNLAAIQASKANLPYVRLEDLEFAKDKIIMGAERKSAVITDENKRLTAFHEGGHTLVAMHTPSAMPLHKVTIIPRGNALGVTVQLPEQDQSNNTKKELLAMLDVCMGGRAAEELVFGADSITTGAVNDLEKATSIAKQMVLRYGMIEEVGLANISDSELEQLSGETRSKIEHAVFQLLEASYERAKAILFKHRNQLDVLASELVEKESLSVQQVREIVTGTPSAPSAPAASSLYLN